jgi:hypothetical protein
MLQRGVGKTMEVYDRTTNAMQMPIDKDSDGSGPAPHDLIEREVVKLFVGHRGSPAMRP